VIAAACTNNSIEPTPEPAAVPLIPQIGSTDVELIYDQETRATLDGKDTFFWPDGNMGFIPLGGDQYRFLAANSVVAARTVGTFDDPGAVVEEDALQIQGASSEFAYVAGGPLYRDPGSDLVLMFYHAERHLDGIGLLFHAAIGLAASHDQGQTFTNLGIILETNAEPDIGAPCCADVGGATFAVKDGQFYLYFRDRLTGNEDVQLALATAPVDEVVNAALNGETSEWLKYDDGDYTPALGGRSSPLEVGNPPTSWFSVSHNQLLDRYIMAIAHHPAGAPSNLYLTTSEDGINWSPRVSLWETEDELTYPTIIDPAGDPLTTSGTFYVYFVTTPRETEYRWHNTPLWRMTATLTGEMRELAREWDFESDTEAWVPLNQMETFEATDGSLVIQASGNDPYMHSPGLGFDAGLYRTIEVRMRLEHGGTGQFFFTGEDAPGILEANSVRFPVTASDGFQTYTIDMSRARGWQGVINLLRFDPVDQRGRIEIDYIKILP
jgi:hypothetical protein